MAKIQNGILGGGRGKVSNVIMGIWKGIDYVKAYAIPANPQSPAQQANRTPWGELARILSLFNVLFIQVYFRSARPRMSGFNAFMQESIAQFRATPGLPVADFLRNPDRNALPASGVTFVLATSDSADFVLPAGYADAGDRLVLLTYNQVGSALPTQIAVSEVELTAGQTTGTISLNEVYSGPNVKSVGMVIKGLRTTRFNIAELS